MIAASRLLKPFWNPIKTAIRNHPYPASFRHYLQNLPPTYIDRICNGLTVATEERGCCNACIALFMDAGSRYECDFENGIAHFFEHIAFKGTMARARPVLEEQMASLGAKYKCFTTRDMTVYYVECLCQDVPLAVDILTDCVYNNAFCVPEIEYQKRIVYSEMLEHDNDPNALVYDYLHSTAFQGTPLAQTVMGRSGNLQGFTNCNICTYTKKFFDPGRTVLASVGGITHTQMCNLAELYLSKLENVKCVDMDPYRYTGSEVRYRNDSLPTANVIIAFEGPCFAAMDNTIMEVAAAVIGGWDQSQPGGAIHATTLAREISTTKCESYKAFNLNYKDTGLWGIQFVAPSLYLEQMVYLIQNEWMYLCNCVTEADVERARREVKMKLLTKLETAAGACLDTGRWVLYNGEMPSTIHRICEIDRVRPDDVRGACTHYIYDRCPVVAAVGPTEGLPDYTRIRSGMYWVRV